MAIVKFIDKKLERCSEYYLEDWVKKRIDDRIKTSLQQNDKDYLIVVDGNERSGKSTVAMQVGRYIDPTLDLSRIVFSPEEFKKAVFEAKKGQVIIYDEAFTGLSSRASLSGINRYLVSLMMQMGQKNLCVILVLPTFFLLDKYAAIFRSKILLHVYENKGRRGYYRVYNQRKKKKLWFEGKKDYSYNVKTKNRGHFYGKFALGDKTIEDKYRKKKEVALEDTEKNPMSAQAVKYTEQRNLLLHIIKKLTNLSFRKMEKLLDDYDFGMTYAQIRLICNKYGDKDDELEEKVEKIKALDEKLVEKEQETKELMKKMEEINKKETNQGINEEKEVNLLDNTEYSDENSIKDDELDDFGDEID